MPVKVSSYSSGAKLATLILVVSEVSVQFGNIHERTALLFVLPFHLGIY